MAGFLFKKVERRKFKYYPRHYKDDKQEKMSPFANSYIEKKLDADMERDALSSGKSFKFKRSVKSEKQKEFLKRTRVNLILLFILASLIYGVYWVITNVDFFYSYGQQWAI